MAVNGKIALVTGASRGIGRAIAERLGRDGASVVVNYRSNRAAAEAVVAVIERAGGAAIAAQADVAEPDQLRGLFELAEQRFDGLDIVVSNVGVAHFGPIASRRRRSVGLAGRRTSQTWWPSSPPSRAAGSPGSRSAPAAGGSEPQRSHESAASRPAGGRPHQGDHGAVLARCGPRLRVWRGNSNAPVRRTILNGLGPWLGLVADSRLLCGLGRVIS